MIHLIAAVDCNFGISKEDRIPWHFCEDLKFFYRETRNSVVVMGRNTFTSIYSQPLTQRTNCVISKTLFTDTGIETFQSLEETISKYKDLWIIGGSQLYNYALSNNLVEHAMITHVHKDYKTDKFISPASLKNFLESTVISSTEYTTVEYKLKPSA